MLYHLKVQNCYCPLMTFCPLNIIVGGCSVFLLANTAVWINLDSILTLRTWAACYLAGSLAMMGFWCCLYVLWVPILHLPYPMPLVRFQCCCWRSNHHCCHLVQNSPFLEKKSNISEESPIFTACSVFYSYHVYRVLVLLLGVLCNSPGPAVDYVHSITNFQRNWSSYFGQNMWEGC